MSSHLSCECQDVKIAADKTFGLYLFIFIYILPHFRRFVTFRPKMRNHGNQKFKT